MGAWVNGSDLTESELTRGHRYLGVATDITYQLLSIPVECGVHTDIATFRSFRDLVEAQIPRALRARDSARDVRTSLSDSLSGAAASDLVMTPDIRAVSSVAFKSGRTIKGAVFEPFYSVPDQPPLPPFPLYDKLDGGLRYAAELMARNDKLDRLFHEGLFALLESGQNRFHDDIHEFSFFMDGNTFAKQRFEREHPGKVFQLPSRPMSCPKTGPSPFPRRAWSG